MTIDELAEQIRKDAYRVKELEKALFWLEQADDEVVAAGVSVDVSPNRNKHEDGGYAASTEIGRHFESLYPQAIALVRDICRAELECIRDRYLPLLMPVSQGSEG